MSKPYFVAVASAAIVTGIVATAHSSTAACSGGELTLKRLQENDCAARIPLPTARPGALSNAAVADQAAPSAEASRTWEFIETPGANPGEKRLVRLVGSRFLPDQSEAINFRGSGNVDLINAAFQRTVSYFGFGPYAPEPEAPREEQAEIQQARVSFELRMTSN